MPRNKINPIFIAIGGNAVSLDPRTGDEIWRAKLKSSGSYATISMSDGRLLVGISGEVFCLNPATGDVLWHNKLKGLGMGVVAFPGSDVAQQAAAIAAAAAGAAV
jgi:outer membrane protein assembly factor BamB